MEVTVPKINIYLPDDLAEQVKTLPNVSAVCQRALLTEVENQRIVSAAALGDLDAIVARLTNSKRERDEEVDQERHTEGRETGIEWARTEAPFAELESVAKVNDENWLTWDITEDDLPSLSTWLESWHGWNFGGSGRVRVTPDDRFVEGLIEGATEVYNAVRERVEG